MATPIPPQVTPDEHIATLVTLAEQFERAAEWSAEAPSPPALGALWRRRAKAIRWILAETAHGVDAEELAG